MQYEILFLNEKKSRVSLLYEDLSAGYQVT
jgi:hypothetical protein